METIDNLTSKLMTLRTAFEAQRFPGAAERIDRIDRCVDLMVENEQAICDAVQKDFGVRGPIMSSMGELMGPIMHARFVRSHLGKWMRPEKRRTNFPYGLLGGRTYIEHQPLGVVGIMVPWNGPVGVAMIGMIDAFSAGNRCMVKLSENAPNAAELLIGLAPQYFAADEIAFVTGPHQVGQAFAELPFDHIVFTGGTEIGRSVMASAARNLVPVTLELGGKCPAIVAHDANFELAANRIAAGRLVNSGQGCITPDYALVPHANLAEFSDLTAQAIRTLYPTIQGNDDYTSMINDRHFSRVVSYIEEARCAGCEIIEVKPHGTPAADPATRLIAPTLIVNPDPELKVMREEIFGPVLPIVPYDTLEDAVAFVNSRPKPLALYYFGQNDRGKRQVLENTMSGGVTVNDSLMHLVMADLPFGGVGGSGMGRYWGGDSGFRNLSNPRGVYEQGRIGKLARIAQPPYGRTVQRLLRSQIRKTR